MSWRARPGPQTAGWCTYQIDIAQFDSPGPATPQGGAISLEGASHTARPAPQSNHTVQSVESSRTLRSVPVTAPSVSRCFELNAICCDCAVLPAALAGVVRWRKAAKIRVKNREPVPAYAMADADRDSDIGDDSPAVIIREFIFCFCSLLLHPFVFGAVCRSIEMLWKKIIYLENWHNSWDDTNKFIKPN